MGGCVVGGRLVSDGVTYGLCLCGLGWVCLCGSCIRWVCCVLYCVPYVWYWCWWLRCGWSDLKLLFHVGLVLLCGVVDAWSRLGVM